MRIAEIYVSRQGEGQLTGVESVFVRTSGCNLRCWFCDTPFTSWAPEGEDWAVAELVEKVLQQEVPHVVVTGGEPMLWAELVPLTVALRDAGRHLTIETAGTLDLDVACDLMSISPKLASSTPPAERDPRWPARHERARQATAVIHRLMAAYPYQMKFVVDCPTDVDEVLEYLEQFPQLDRRQVWLMPQGRSAEELAVKESWLPQRCGELGLQYCPRRQFEWYGGGRRT